MQKINNVNTTQEENLSGAKIEMPNEVILEKYKNTEHISLMRDYDSVRKVSHGKFT